MLNAEYWFSIAIIINHHRFHGLKYHKFIILQFCSSEVQHKSHWAKIILRRLLFVPETLEKNLFLCILQHLEAPFSIFKANNVTSTFRPCSHFPDSALLPSSSTFKNPCDYIWATLVIQDDLSIFRPTESDSYLKHNYLCHVTSHNHGGL